MVVVEEEVVTFTVTLAEGGGDGGGQKGREKRGYGIGK